MAKQTVKCSEVWRDCIYAGIVCSGGSGHKVFSSCDYMLKTSERRGCNPEECTRFKSRKKEVK